MGWKSFSSSLLAQIWKTIIPFGVPHTSKAGNGGSGNMGGRGNYAEVIRGTFSVAREGGVCSSDMEVVIVIKTGKEAMVMFPSLKG